MVASLVLTLITGVAFVVFARLMFKQVDSLEHRLGVAKAELIWRRGTAQVTESALGEIVDDINSTLGKRGPAEGQYGRLGRRQARRIRDRLWELGDVLADRPAGE